MHRRVESMFVIQEEKTKNMIMEYLNFYWKDNTNSWKLNSDGCYTQIGYDLDDEAFSAQDALLERTSKLF
jgi:polyphosphate kinase